ncbi:MAG: hypothetical protein HQL38_00160, partial [Alphaproteobacteria bacterium]|nr:hypothetical protein [Alphaproteobacteria bacterium]
MPRRVLVVLLAALLMAPATDALSGWRAEQAKEQYPPKSETKEQPKREEPKPAPAETPRRQPTTVTRPTLP